MVLTTETFNQSVCNEYSEAVNARYTFQPLWVSDKTKSRCPCNQKNQLLFFFGFQNTKRPKFSALISKRHLFILDGIFLFNGPPLLTLSSLESWVPFLESPENFSGPKSHL